MKNDFLNFQELIEASVFLENIGEKNSIENSLNYTFISCDEINNILKSNKTINCDTEIMNNFRTLIYDNLGQSGLKEYNKFILESKSEFYARKDEVFNIFLRKNLSEDIALNFMEMYFNSTIEAYFKERYSIDFFFFGYLMQFFKKGHVVCGYQFLTVKHNKLYDILNYAVDNFSITKKIDKSEILVFIY
ncbi:hypothetical protein [Acinetobacter higginsii]|uniref:hypothetical protein n=1 Tax=Acinetobacter higginsii TaxID=70347 RepID=UPI00300B3620